MHWSDDIHWLTGTTQIWSEESSCWGWERRRDTLPDFSPLFPNQKPSSAEEVSGNFAEKSRPQVGTMTLSAKRCQKLSSEIRGVL